MPESRSLVLWRHGRTLWNLQDRSQGHTDIELDEVGHAQAAAAAPALAALAPTRLWSSDLRRATATAAYLAELTGLEVHTDSRLREYDVGVRSGLDKAEFAARFPAEHAAWLSGDEGLRVPGEESSEQVAHRMAAGLGDCWNALDAGELGVVVLHGASLKLGLGALLGWPPGLHRTLRGVGNCSWVVVNELHGRARLAAYNVSVGAADTLDFSSDGPIG